MIVYIRSNETGFRSLISRPSKSHIKYKCSLIESTSILVWHGINQNGKTQIRSFLIFME